MNMNSEIVILMPVYNPREEIINYIKKLKKERYSIVVVNDGSDEKYHSIFESLVDDCTIINYPVSKGKGNAIKKGLNFIKENNQDRKGILILEEDYPIDKMTQLNELFKQEKIFFIHTKGKRIFSNLRNRSWRMDFSDMRQLRFCLKYLFTCKESQTVQSVRQKRY